MLIFQLIASAFGVDLITAEIEESLSIIFTRDFKSLEVAAKLCDKNSKGLEGRGRFSYGEPMTLSRQIEEFLQFKASARRPDGTMNAFDMETCEKMRRKLPRPWKQVLQYPPGDGGQFTLRKYQGGTPMLSDFRHYRGHLAVIQKDMKDWGPENFRDLLQPGYKDRFVWFATVFGLIIAAVGIIGVITSIISTAVAIITLQATWKLIVLAEEG